MSWWYVYGRWDRGYRNYPQVGQVLRHYRELRGYTLAKTGKAIEDAAESTAKSWETKGLVVPIVGTCDEKSFESRSPEVLIRSSSCR